MDFIICFCICICLVTIFAIYIGNIVKQGKKRDGEMKTTAENIDEIKNEFETLKFNATIIDLTCRVEMVGIKQPKTVTFFTVCFETDNNERIKIDVPQEMYDGLEVGQKGELTLVGGELYSFII